MAVRRSFHMHTTSSSLVGGEGGKWDDGCVGLSMNDPLTESFLPSSIQVTNDLACELGSYKVSLRAQLLL